MANNNTFLEQQFFITARAYYPSCTFKEVYAPDYAPYCYVVYDNDEYKCHALWYPENGTIVYQTI